MKLIYSPGACSLSPHIVLRELGYQFELLRYNFADGMLADGRKMADVNPKGYVPALELDNGELLTEGATIVQYLADQKPGNTLLPAEGMARYRVLEWLTYVSSEVHKGMGGLFDRQAGPEQRARSIENIHKKLAFVDGILAEKEYLTGSYSLADIYMFVCVRWEAHFDDLDITPYANLQAYMKRMEEKPMVAQAIGAEQ